MYSYCYIFSYCNPMTFKDVIKETTSGCSFYYRGKVYWVGSCATQTAWLRKLLSQSQHYQNKPTFYDNKYIIALTKNRVFHGRSKHISIKWFGEWSRNHGWVLFVWRCRYFYKVSDLFWAWRNLKNLVQGRVLKKHW